MSDWKKNDGPERENVRREQERLVMGRNAVREALRSGHSIERMYVAEGVKEGSMGELLRLARDHHIRVETVERAKLDLLTDHGVHQGVALRVSAADYATVEDILTYAKDRGEAPFIAVLDGVEDPHNLGSILRTAECCGVHGVIIPKRRSAGLTSTVSKVASGAAEYVKVARVANIAQTLEQLKKEGLWVAGAHMEGEAYTKVDLTGPLALVVGGEGAGISRIVREKCDFLCRIPMKGRIDSLNASVAAAVLLYEAVRQRS